MGFFFESKTECGNLPQFLNLVFQVNFSGILLKITDVGLPGTQKIHILSLVKWAWICMKKIPTDFGKSIFKE